jgi:hypothetical protein
VILAREKVFSNLLDILTFFMEEKMMKNLNSWSTKPKRSTLIGRMQMHSYIVTYLDGLQAKFNALREVQTESGKELSALMPSILDKAFKGELLSPVPFPAGKGCLLARKCSLPFRGGPEWSLSSAMIPSILDKAFKEEL